MLKRIGLVVAFMATLAMSTTAFAQAPGDLPSPAENTRIQFVPGTTAYTLTTNLHQGASQGYVLGLAATQVLYVLQSSNASVQVFDPQGIPLAAPTTQAGPWGVAIHQTGDYTVVLLGQGNVSVSLYVPPLGASAHPPVPLPFFSPRISFTTGTSGTSFGQDLAQGEPVGYLLGISAQQQLTAVTQGNMTVALLDDHQDALLPVVLAPGQWRFAIPETGDYTLVLLGSGTVFVSLGIPPISTPTPPPTTLERINFPPGADSITIQPMLLADPAQSFVLGISRGQTLYISTSVGAKVQVFDPQGNQVAPMPSPSGGLAYGIAQNGDYTASFRGLGPTNITFFIPPLPGWF